jgi:hypothetical protein
VSALDPPDVAPGWDAIQSALAQVFPGQDPLHWGTSLQPGQDGVYGVSAYRGDGWWLLITFGLTELFGKSKDDADVSGWGFELTMRVPAEREIAPPTWSLNLLSKLGQYVYTEEAPVAVGHRMDLGGPITGTDDTRLTALAVAADPQLAGIQTPNGSVAFLTLVGITANELAQMKISTTAEVLDEYAVRSPLLITDPNR